MSVKICLVYLYTSLKSAYLYREMKYVMWFDRMYQQFYLPSHMNFGPYLFGMITGVILHKIRLFKIKLGPSKVRIFKI